MLIRTAAVALAVLFLAQPAAAQPAPQAAPVAVAADPALPPYVPGAPVSGSVSGATGMDSVEQMMAAWTEAFGKYHPGAHITLTQKDLAPEERIGLGPDTDEVFHADDGPYEDRYGYQPFRIRICQGAFVLKSHVSAIGVFVSKANPIGELSMAKLDAIYSDARRRGYAADITTWGQLGLTGNWADKPIHIYGFYWRDDVTWYFRDMVSYDAPFKASYRAPGEGLSRRTPAVARDLMQTLTSDPYAIGFGNFSYQTDGVKALALSDEHGVLSQPILGDMVSGRYPLQRSIYIYVNRKPGQPLSPLIKEFLTFVLSKEGQDLVQRDHYLPLTAAMAAAERAKLN
ncbi:MAG TPA: substrate-binding domain-containing protein [Caulobacteraceae bacterium]